MPRMILPILAVLILGAGHALAAPEAPPMPESVPPLTASNLRCEYLRDPLGIDVERPRLSWEVTDPTGTRRGARQSAYRILVASSPERLAMDVADIWDSRRTPMALSAHRVYGGPVLAPGTQVWWKVAIWDEAGRRGADSRPATWSVGPRTREDWGGAEWIGAPPQDPAEAAGPEPVIPPSPLLRHNFMASQRVRRAILHASALGVYELRLNGRRLGDQWFAPEWTDYTERIQYQTHDVTRLLHEGRNVIAATLADGWYAGRLGPTRWDKEFPRRGVYGIDRRLLAKLDIEYVDGSKETVVTNGDWKIWTDGPVRSADFFLGETHDARKRVPNWDRVTGDDRDWAQAHVGLWPDAPLVAQPNEPVRVVATVDPVAVTEPAPGVHIFDFGQNLVGWCRLSVQSRAGTEVTLRHGEMLNEDGSLYTENLAAAVQTDRFLLAGDGLEVFEPQFTYHGFRYVEVTGLPRKPRPDQLKAIVVASDTGRAGHFRCSNPMLNQLAENIFWTLRGNLISVPTDCPQRDERMGWAGDMQVFAQTAIFNMDMGAFFTKWVRDIRDAQASDGRFADIIPHPYDKESRFTNAPGWADVGVILPWRQYVNYGDTRILEDHYDAMRRFIGHVRAENPDLVWRNSVGNHYGDWLNGDTIKAEGYPATGGELDKTIYATMFFAHSTDLLAQAARVIGREDDAAAYAALHAEIRDGIVSRWVDAEGRIAGDTQAGYALALHFDLLPVALRPKAADHLAAAIARYDNRISTGFQSTYRMMLELTRWGRNDLAHLLAESTRFPSWGYSIGQGATTIWERWDGYVKGRGFQDPGMNSFNHYAIGAVGEWMYRVILGINPDPDQPGFRHFTLRPRPGGTLTDAFGSYRSIAGPISVRWAIEDGRFNLLAAVPPNTMATVVLPVAADAPVLEGEGPAAEQPGIQPHAPIEGCATFLVESGVYQFSAPWAAATP